MEIRPLTYDELTNFFINDTQLIMLGLSDEEIGYLGTYNKYPVCEFAVYRGVFDDSKLVGVVKYETLTTETVNFHMYISSDLHKTKKVFEIADTIKDYMINEVSAIKAVLMVPLPCTHVHQFVPKWGWKKECTITNSMRWRNEITDIIIYSIDIRGI